MKSGYSSRKGSLSNGARLFLAVVMLSIALPILPRLSASAQTRTGAPVPPGSRVYSKANVTYVLVPRRGTWPQAEAYAREFAAKHFPGQRSLLWSPRSRAEYDDVRVGLRFGGGQYWVGYHRPTPANPRDPRIGWRSVAGTPVVFETFNGKVPGPDMGCKNKFKIEEFFVGNDEVSGSGSYGSNCKPKENSGITFDGPWSLLEDVSENHSKAQGLIVEIRR